MIAGVPLSVLARPLVVYAVCCTSTFLNILCEIQISMTTQRACSLPVACGSTDAANADQQLETLYKEKENFEIRSVFLSFYCTQSES